MEWASQPATCRSGKGGGYDLNLRMTKEISP